jgi:hypothetical protein
MKPMPSPRASRLLPVTVQMLGRKRRLLVAGVCATVWLSGCVVFASNDDSGRSWSGKPLAQLTQAWGNPAAQEIQADGSTEIRYDMGVARCTYWFTADKAGKIVAYRYEVGQWGTCKPI